VQGLDSWNYRGTETDPKVFVEEPRLKDKLEERYGLRLADEYYFRRPPAGEDDEPNPGLGIRVLEFPAYFVCQGCRRLLHRSILGDAVKADGRRFHAECESKRNTVVPVRFVGACRRGHLQDFPWKKVAHYGRDFCEHGTLTFTDQPIEDESFTIGNVTFTAKDSGATGNQWNITAGGTAAADAAGNAASVAALINAHASLSKFLTATSALGVVTVTCDVPGDIGNALQFADVDLANATVSDFATEDTGDDGTEVNLSLL